MATRGDTHQIVINSPSVTIVHGEEAPARAVVDWLESIDADELETAVLAGSGWGTSSIAATLSYLLAQARAEAG